MGCARILCRPPRGGVHYTLVAKREGHLGRPQPSGALRGGGPRGAQGHGAARADTRRQARRVRPRLRLQGTCPRRKARPALQPLRTRARPLGPVGPRGQHAAPSSRASLVSTAPSASPGASSARLLRRLVSPPPSSPGAAPPALRVAPL